MKKPIGMLLALIIATIASSNVFAGCYMIDTETCSQLVNHSIIKCQDVDCEFPSEGFPYCPPNNTGSVIKTELTADVYRDVFPEETGYTMVALGTPVVCLVSVPCTGCDLVPGPSGYRLVCQNGSQETAQETYYRLSFAGSPCP